VNACSAFRVDGKRIDVDARSCVATGQRGLCTLEELIRPCVLVAIVGDQLVE